MIRKLYLLHDSKIVNDTYRLQISFSILHSMVKFFFEILSRMINFHKRVLLHMRYMPYRLFSTAFFPQAVAFGGGFDVG